MTNNMNRFLNSDEYNTWQESFRGIINYLRNGCADEHLEREFVMNLLTNHLFASIDLGIAYSKEKD